MDERKVDLLNYLPPILQEVRDFKDVFSGETTELNLLWKRIRQALLDQFLSTSGLYGIARWEELLGLNPKGTDTLETRRFRVMVRLGEQLPYTITILRQWLENACGKDLVMLKLEHLIYKLIVRINTASGVDMQDVDRYLRMVIPANLLLDLMFFTQIHLERGNIYVGAHHDTGTILTIHPYTGGEFVDTAPVKVGGVAITGTILTLAPNKYEERKESFGWPWQPGNEENEVKT